MLIFSSPGAVRPRSVGTSISEHPVTGDSGQRALNSPEEESNGLSQADGLRVSIRLFLPVEIPLANRWEPSEKVLLLGFRYSDYATILRILGWILVPLGIAALTGLLRRAER
jgi:hypothetical protein